MAYLFIALTSGVKPKSKKESIRTTSSRVQQAGAQICLRINGFDLAGFEYVYSTSKTKDFFSTATFKKLLSQSSKENASIIVYDSFALFSFLTFEKVQEHVSTFEETGVTVYDVKTGIPLNKCSKQMLEYYYTISKIERDTRSRMRKSDQSARPSNTGKATKANSRKSRVFDHRLKKEIEIIISEIRLTEKVTLEKITDALNKRGFYTITGVAWSTGNIQKKINQFGMTWK